MNSSFVARMRHAWEVEKGLACSDELVESWRLIPNAIDRARLNPSTVHAVSLPTGSGKTEGLSVWCGVSTPEQRAGILCATRFKAEADRIAETINVVAGRRVALAHHSGSPQPTSEMTVADVLVVTHQTLAQALSDIAISQASTQRLDRLLARPIGKRRLLLIDEAFDWIDTTAIDLAELRAMAAALYRSVPAALQPFVVTLSSVAQKLTDALAESEGVFDHSFLSPLSSIPFGELAETVSAMPATELELWVQSDEVGIGLKAKYADLLQSVWRVTQSGNLWISKRGGRQHLFAVRNLLLPELPATIVFDATADIDPSYDLAVSRIVVSRPDKSPRRYDKVELHVSRGHRVGKTHLSAEAPKEWPKLKSALDGASLGSGVLICCHKAARATVESAPLSGISFSVANWGALDGKNDWRDCSSIVLFGLPYLDDTAPTNALLGWQKLRADSWVAGSSASREKEQFVSAYRTGFIAKCLVQAINRIQCRIPINAEGHCKPTHVYLLLPNGETGDRIMEMVRTAMPGIEITDWQAAAAKSSTRRSPVFDTLVSFFANAHPGRYPKTAVAKALGIGVSSIGRLLTSSNKNHASFMAALSHAGTSYQTQTGRGCEAQFLKQ